MKKVYKDLIIAGICVILILKFTKFAIIIAGVLVAVWFFVLDEKKKKEIKDKIKYIYNR